MSSNTKKTISKNKVTSQSINKKINVKSKSPKVITTKPKETRHYTCTRRVDKLGKKIWVVLEDGRKFYRIFKNRSLAITYFSNLKTVYAEMLVQDLMENIYTSIIYTKLKIRDNKSLEAIEEIKGAIVEESDTLFDEETFFVEDIKQVATKDVEKPFVINKIPSFDVSTLENLFPKKKSIISDIKINIDTSKNTTVDKTLIKDEYGIKIYQSDIDLSFYLLGEEFYIEQKKKVDKNK